MNYVSEREEMLLPEPARTLGALLGVPVPDLARGEGLPMLVSVTRKQDEMAAAVRDSHGRQTAAGTLRALADDPRQAGSGGLPAVETPFDQHESTVQQ